MFQFQPYFLTCLSLKLCPLTPIKVYFRNNHTKAISSHSLASLNCSLLKHLKMAVFGCISSTIGKNGTWLLNCCYGYHKVLDTLTDSTPTSLKILQKGLHELAEGCSDPPPPPPPPPRPSTTLWEAKDLNKEGSHSPELRVLTVSRKTFNKFVQLTPSSRSILLPIYAPRK